jgi:virginiamycin B lyase
MTALGRRTLLGLLAAASVVQGSIAGDIAGAADLNIAQRAIATLHIPGEPDLMVADGDAVWINVWGKLQKFRRTSEQPILSVVTPEPCGAPVIAFGDLWTADCKELAVYRIDADTGAVKAVVRSGLADPEGELSVTAGARSVWVASDRGGVLARIDPRVNEVVATIAVAPNSYGAMFGFGAVWVTSRAEPGLLQRIDPASNSVSHTISVGPKPRFLAVGSGSVWTLSQGDGTVSRVDPHANRVLATIAVDGPPKGGDIDVGAGRVWVRGEKVTLSEIDPRSNEVVARYRGPAESGAVSVKQGGAVRVATDGVWVTAYKNSTAWVLARSSK